MAKAASARRIRSSSWSVVSNGRRVGSASADKRHLNRPQDVAQLAPAGLAQTVRCDIADRLDHHAAGTQPRRLMDLVAHGSVGVES